MSKKKTTIEDLAIMVQRGFKETARKEDVDKRFDATDKRIDAIDKRMATKEDLRNTQESLGRHIEGLELKVSAYAPSWTHDFKNLHEWVEDLAERLESVERKVK